MKKQPKRPKRPNKPRHPFKFKTCEVCGREYRAFPHRVRKSIVYRSPCEHCGALDFAISCGQGHLELMEYDEKWDVERRNNVTDIHGRPHPLSQPRGWSQ